MMTKKFRTIAMLAVTGLAILMHSDDQAGHQRQPVPSASYNSTKQKTRRRFIRQTFQDI